MALSKGSAGWLQNASGGGNGLKLYRILSFAGTVAEFKAWLAGQLDKEGAN